MRGERHVIISPMVELKAPRVGMLSRGAKPCQRHAPFLCVAKASRSNGRHKRIARLTGATVSRVADNKDIAVHVATVVAAVVVEGAKATTSDASAL